MGSGFRVGKLFGINLYIDWSWFLIFLLITWNLAGAFFPQLHPEWTLGLNLLLGVVASLLFFGSVLAHELAHSLVARGLGMPVRRITLFIFGGVSNIEREPPSPGAEFFMTVVGPLTSLVLGVLFLLGAGQSVPSLNLAAINPTGLLSNLGPLPTLFLWLGSVNILLGIFNLVPAFPLDGGRILRAFFWGLTDNLRRATRWASSIGQAFAWLFIFAGVAMFFGVRLPVFGSGFLSGVWLVFIGWFLINASSQGYRQVVIQDMLEGVPVTRLMWQSPPRIARDMTLNEVVYDYFMGNDTNALPVVEGDRLIGMVTLEGIRQVPRAEWDNTRIEQIMVPIAEVPVSAPNEDATEAFERLNRREVAQMPVVQAGRLVGMIRQRDIVRWLQLQSDAFSR